MNASETEMVEDYAHIISELKEMWELKAEDEETLNKHAEFIDKSGYSELEVCFCQFNNLPLDLAPAAQPVDDGSADTQPVDGSRKRAVETSTTNVPEKKQDSEDDSNIDASPAGNAGFEWPRSSPNKSSEEPVSWEDRFKQLKEYHEKHGHTSLPSAGDKEHRRVYGWVKKQESSCRKIEEDKSIHNGARVLTRNLQLTDERLERLKKLGFTWAKQDSKTAANISWMSMLQKLKEHKKTHGTVHIAKTDKEKPALGKWVHLNRQRYGRGTLPPDRFKLLDDLGFVWAPRRSRVGLLTFKQRLAQCIEWKRKHGHLNTPHPSNKKSDDAEWTREQSFYRWARYCRWEYHKMYPAGVRNEYRSHVLNAEKIKSLKNLDFNFDFGVNSSKKEAKGKSDDDKDKGDQKSETDKELGDAVDDTDSD